MADSVIPTECTDAHYKPQLVRCVVFKCCLLLNTIIPDGHDSSHYYRNLLIIYTIFGLSSTKTSENDVTALQTRTK
jgi:hypothetical protein